MIILIIIYNHCMDLHKWVRSMILPIFTELDVRVSARLLDVWMWLLDRTQSNCHISTHKISNMCTSPPPCGELGNGCSIWPYELQVGCEVQECRHRVEVEGEDYPTDPPCIRVQIGHLQWMQATTENCRIRITAALGQEAGMSAGIGNGSGGLSAPRYP